MFLASIDRFLNISWCFSSSTFQFKNNSMWHLSDPFETSQTLCQTPVYCFYSCKIRLKQKCFLQGVIFYFLPECYYSVLYSIYSSFQRISWRLDSFSSNRWFFFYISYLTLFPLSLPLTFCSSCHHVPFSRRYSVLFLNSHKIKFHHITKTQHREWVCVHRKFELKKLRDYIQQRQNLLRIRKALHLMMYQRRSLLRKRRIQ